MYIVNHANNSTFANMWAKVWQVSVSGGFARHGGAEGIEGVEALGGSVRKIRKDTAPQEWLFLKL